MGSSRAPLARYWIAPDGTRVPILRGGTTASLTQTHARFRFDDGTEVTATGLAAEDANATIPAGRAFRIRIQVDETAGGASNNFVGVLRYSHLGGAFTPVTASSTVVQAVASPNLTDEEATTPQLSAPTGTFEPGAVDEADGSAGTTQVDIPAGGYTEFEWSVQIVAADVATGDTIDFQCYRGTNALNSYAVTIRATVQGIDTLGFNRENHQTARPTYAPSPHAALSALVAAFGFPPQFLATTEGPLDGDVLGAPILLQYDGTVGPVFVTTPVVVPDHFSPIYPERIPVAILATAAQPTGAWTPLHQDAEGAALDWTARYPDWLPPIVLPPGARPSVTRSLQPEHRESLDHQPVYPDRIWRTVLPVAALPFADGRNLDPIITVVVPEQWPPSYPDWIPSLPALRTALQQAVAYFPTRQEGATTGWHPWMPDWIARRRLPTSQQQAWIGPVEPVVLGPAPDLSWRASYPDAARRPWLLRHLQPWWASPVSLFPHYESGGPVDAALFATGLLQYTSLVGPLRFSLPIQAEGPTWQSVVQHWLARRLYHARLQQPMSWPLERFRDEQMHWQPIIQLTDGPAEATVASGMTPGPQA